MPSAPHAASDVSTSSATSDPAASGDSKSVSVQEPPITDQEREQVLAEFLAELNSDAPSEPPDEAAPAPNGTASAAPAAGANGASDSTVVTSGSMSSFR